MSTNGGASFYEGPRQPPLNRVEFFWRLLRHLAFALSIVLAFLLVGMFGYKWIVKVPTWADAFLNAAMLMGGMGPVATITTESGKLFAGFYALIAGLVFVAVAGIMLTPVVHRTLHRFHWSDQGDSDEPTSASDADDKE